MIFGGCSPTGVWRSRHYRAADITTGVRSVQREHRIRKLLTLAGTLQI
jgi:hypothetical protein